MIRILVVDDDHVSRRLIAHNLKQQGFEVFVASNGSEALRVRAENDCRLVITDWEMPAMDGIELSARIRSETVSGYVYIIIMTSFQERAHLIQAMNAGADDFMTKPFDPEELSVRVKVAKRVLSLESREVAILAMAKLAESRDFETGLHVERVGRYSRLLAGDLVRNSKYAEVISPDFPALLELTSALHDIGKVGIPDAILLKPDRLNDDEFAIMKKHSEIGAATLASALQTYPEAEFLKMAHDIALSHHERWNGTGYPHKLSGEDIPLSARIVALADVYDALTSKRVYKPAMDHTAARLIILGESGKHFDPEIVESFRRVELDFIRISSELADAPASQPASDTKPIVVPNLNSAESNALLAKP
jgi:putative two-component system response regulator